jgi:hypothetical protein
MGRISGLGSLTPVGNRGPGWSNRLACNQDAAMANRVTVIPAIAKEWPVVEQLAHVERHDLSQFRG